MLEIKSTLPKQREYLMLMVLQISSEGVNETEKCQVLKEYEYIVNSHFSAPKSHAVTLSRARMNVGEDFTRYPWSVNRRQRVSGCCL